MNLDEIKVELDLVSSLLGLLSLIIPSIIWCVNKMWHHINSAIDQYEREGEELYLQIIFGELLGVFFAVCVGLLSTPVWGENSNWETIYLDEYLLCSIYPFIIFVMMSIIFILIKQKTYNCQLRVTVLSALIYVLFFGITVVDFFDDAFAFQMYLGLFVLLLMVAQYKYVVVKTKTKQLTYCVYTSEGINLKTEQKPQRGRDYAIIRIVQDGRLEKLIEMSNKDIVKVETIVEYILVEDLHVVG